MIDKIIFRIIGLTIFFLFLIQSCKTKNNVADLKTTEEVNYIPYYLKVYEADSLFLCNNFDKSYRLLDELFKTYKPVDTDNYSEYSIYLNSAVRSGNIKGITDKVRFGYLNFGGIVSLHPESYEMYMEIMKISELNNNEVDSLKDVYFNNLDLRLRKQMLEMFEDDQTVRQNGSSIQEMDSIDAKNNKELIAIFEAYGYPNKKLIGGPSAYEIPGGDIYEGILIMHQPESFLKKYLLVLYQNVKKGNCDPLIYAQAYDRLLLDKTGKQYFGTMVCGGQEDFCDITNPQKVDSIRKSVGLPNIKYQSWKAQKLHK